MGSWSLFFLLPCRVLCMFVVVVIVMAHCLFPKISEFEARPGQARQAKQARPSIHPRHGKGGYCTAE
jgi:hypothetical protein